MGLLEATNIGYHVNKQLQEMENTCIFSKGYPGYRLGEHSRTLNVLLDWATFTQTIAIPGSLKTFYSYEDIANSAHSSSYNGLLLGRTGHETAC